MRAGMKIAAVCAAMVAISAPAARALAWHEDGHRSASRAAVGAIARDAMPAFFLEGAGMIAHASVDPDLFARPIAPAELGEAESPEHYIDIELFEGRNPLEGNGLLEGKGLLESNSLPHRRYEFLDLCAARKIDPRKAGLLPFAITEYTQRLTVALAENRKWPENPYIRSKCLLHAGMLSHYAADLCQPLHTTIHYDGWARPDGNSPHSGIHMKVDALLGKVPFDANQPLEGVVAVPMDDLWAGVMNELAASHALVPKVYDLEKGLPAYEAPLPAGTPSAAFGQDRLRACARFIASLYLTAWRDSRRINLPEWHHRESFLEKPSDANSAAAR